MSDDEKISVLIPVFNSSKYLRECISSILSQSYQNFECICVDDGSFDDSFKILQEYANKDKRIKIFHQENKGVSFSRNFLLQKAEGKYIFFLDSDDYIHHQALEIMLSFIKSEKAEMVEADILGVPESIIPQEFFINFYGNEIKAEVITDMNTFLLKRTRKGRWINMGNKLYLRDSLENIRFNQKLFYEDDFLFHSILHIKIKKKVICNFYALFYRNNPISVTNNLNFDKYLHSGIERIKCHYDFFIKSNHVPENHIKEFEEDLVKDAYRMILHKNLRKNKNAQERKRLFYFSANAFENMIKDGILKPKLLPFYKRIVLSLILKRYYYVSKIMSFF